MEKLINNKDYEGIKMVLMQNPDLANKGIAYDDVNTATAHPLHRICDKVFSSAYTEKEAVALAKIFLEYGANIDGNKLTEKQDTPLIAASSLHADQLAIFYIENGANINHAGCHGGTALHWAAWCGRPMVVERLIQEGAAINKCCIDFQATPLFWAVHGLKKGGKNNLHQQLDCINILIQAGADKNIPNVEGKTVFDFIDEEDWELKEQLDDR